jgi:micrococcal nuclease
VLRAFGRPSVASVVVLIVLVVLVLRQWSAGDGDGGDERQLPSTLDAEVTRVLDGDTVEATVDGREEDVRYIGVDTPESVKPDSPVECFGPEAAAFNRRLVEGEEVRLELGEEQRDDYGRLLAYVRLGDMFVNAELLRRGYATILTIPPNDEFAALFGRLEREAAVAGVGLWGRCEP